MNAPAAAIAKLDLHKLQQALKWVVYSLLIINWGFYIAEDWTRAVHTLGPNSTILDWTREFATSIDESAWFVLLFMFELETYILEDESWTGWVAKTVHGIRLVCILMLTHTIYAFAVGVVEYQTTVAVDNVSSLCDLADQDVSYVYNLEYATITRDNCQDLSNATTFYRVGDDPVVATLEGLNLERRHAWADLIEAVAWVLIIAAIELVVRLQERGITSGTTIAVANRLKFISYLVIVVLSAWWATLSHWLYAWDEFLWIAGFAAIEMNINEWREELTGEDRL